MTAIAGYIDKENGYTYLASDSLSSDKKTSRVTGSKIIKKENMLLGCSGSIRFKNILRYDFQCPNKKEGQSTASYINVDFRKALVKAFTEGNAITKDKEAIEIPGAVLIAIEDQLFQMQCDTAIFQNDYGYMSIGSGSYHVSGAIQALKENTSLKPDVILKKSVAIASNHVMSVGGDVFVEALKH